MKQAPRGFWCVYVAVGGGAEESNLRSGSAKPLVLPMKSEIAETESALRRLTLARNYRAGELTPLRVPDAAHEALRDLLGTKLAEGRLKKDQQLRAAKHPAEQVSCYLATVARTAHPWGVKALGRLEINTLRGINGEKCIFPCNFLEPAQRSLHFSIIFPRG